MNDPEKTTVRSAWLEFGTGSAKNMDNEGGRPFAFPGKGPRLRKHVSRRRSRQPRVLPVHRSQDRLPERAGLRALHRGVAPRCQPALEEVLQVAGFLRALHQYVWSRYQANNTVLSPIHLDIISESVGPDDYVRAIQHGDGEVRSAAVRHAALGECQSFDAGELGRRFVGHAAPDRQHARAQQLLVSDRNLPRAASAARR